MKNRTCFLFNFLMMLFVACFIASLAKPQKAAPKAAVQLTSHVITGSNFRFMIRLPSEFKQVKRKEPHKDEFDFADASGIQTILVTASTSAYFQSEFEKQYKVAELTQIMKLPAGSRGIIDYDSANRPSSHGPSLANMMLKLDTTVIGVRYKRWTNLILVKRIMESIGSSVKIMR